MDKDQLIEKPKINIVGVIANHQFNWYICSNDMWTMDIDKYIQATSKHVWMLISPIYLRFNRIFM
ncbi:hypothetical protein DXC36_00785 [Streptococcus parasanguinis]|nr:hypothetical protein DXC36_00785 [Streptococcus parasanguinis]